MQAKTLLSNHPPSPDLRFQRLTAYLLLAAELLHHDKEVLVLVRMAAALLGG